MKTFLFLFSILCLVQVLPNEKAAAPEQSAVTDQPATAPGFDSLAAQRQLLIAPKVMDLPMPAAPAPAAAVQGTQEVGKDSTETSGQPIRLYQSENNILTIEDQHQIQELPYVTLPQLFVPQTADLINADSLSTLEQLASVLLTVSAAEPGAVFAVEGHASVEGAVEVNKRLTVVRAQRVCDELTEHYGIPAGIISAHGYGSGYARHPNGAQAEMQQDWRILVVRMK